MSRGRFEGNGEREGSGSEESYYTLPTRALTSAGGKHGICPRSRDAHVKWAEAEKQLRRSIRAWHGHPYKQQLSNPKGPSPGSLRRPCLLQFQLN